ncbi:MAG: FAD-dependent oxidoreductase [Candidatus Latescibacteria bacterium]|nr:FAD-dependent oxidoreductase [Candidatus Latescibacterota bacterium]
METEKLISEGRSSQQEISAVFDLVVCGGGLAGVCAALAASRLGLKTALIQDRPVLGGNSSSEIRVPLAGAANGNPWAREGGIIEELTLTERFNNFTSRRESMINDVWDLVLYDACREEEHLSLYLNTSVRRVKKESNRLTSVFASQLGSEREFEIRGNLFADATGDGVIAYLAGAAYRMGRERKDEFNEKWAPPKPDMGIMGSSTLFAVRDVGKPVPFRPPSWAEHYPADSIALKTRFHHRLPGHWWIEVGFPFHTIYDNEQIRDELMRHVLGVWDHMKNQEDHGFAQYALDWIGKVPGKRESRRIMGDAILTGNDVMQGRNFPDAVAHGGWYFDLHTPGGILAKDEAPEPTYRDAALMDLCAVPVYSIPLRCLYSKDIKNLFLAGRDISVTHVALGSVRLMSTCAAMGQAVGTCAWLCKESNVLPGEVVSTRIGRLQQQLLKEDHYVPGVKNEDPADLARIAKVSVSSSSPLLFPEPTVPRQLDIPLGEVIPVSTDRLEIVRFLMEAEEDTEVTLHLRSTGRTCDFTDERDVACVTAKVPSQGKGWVDFKISAEVCPKNLYWLALDSNPQVIVYGSGVFTPTGTVPLHKPYERWHYLKPTLSWRHLKAVHQRWALCLKTEPLQYPYGPENILSGVTRSDCWTNLWVSDPGLPLPQSAVLKFESPVSFTTIYVTFDTNLSLTQNLHLPTWQAPAETVRDYRLLYEREGEWKEIGTFGENFLRRRVHTFERITADKIKVEVLSTWGCPSARIFEIRVYDE